jgi:hypothetical protein
LSASLWEYLITGLALYLLVLTLPFAALVWAMLIKSLMGGDVYKNNVTPGVYPKWSRMHLRIWCISRIESMVLVPLAGIAVAVRRALRSGSSGAKVGKIFSALMTSVLYGPLDPDHDRRRRRD